MSRGFKDRSETVLPARHALSTDQHSPTTSCNHIAEMAADHGQSAFSVTDDCPNLVKPFKAISKGIAFPNAYRSARSVPSFHRTVANGVTTESRMVG